jgi:hypothetical protein
MVARDGIEPPTPAFSGPRSTTELPGLSADLKLHCPARIPAVPAGVGGSTCRAMQQLHSVYQPRILAAISQPACYATIGCFSRLLSGAFCGRAIIQTISFSATGKTPTHFG